MYHDDNPDKETVVIWVDDDGTKSRRFSPGVNVHVIIDGPDDN